MMITTKQLGVDGCQILAAVTLAGGTLHVDSIASLADELGSTHKKLRTALSKLVTAGVIEVNSRRNAGTEIRLINLQPKSDAKTTEKKNPEQVKTKPEKVKKSANEVKPDQERPKEYWQKLTEKLAPVLFDRSESWSNNLKRKWIRLVDDFGEEVADKLIKAIEAADWIREKGNLSLSLLVANADKILAGRYGRIFEGKKQDIQPQSNIKRSKAALCVGGDSAKDDFLKLFK